MQKADDLVNRLRDIEGYIATEMSTQFIDAYGGTCLSAADRIEELGRQIAERDRYRKVLEEIAGQKTLDELTFEQGRAGDFEGAYDAIVEIARNALEGK